MLETTIFGNTILNYILCLALFLGSLFVLGILNAIILKRLRDKVKASVSPIDDFALHVFEKTIWPLLYVAAIYFSLRQLELNNIFAQLLHRVMIVVAALQATRLVVAVTLYATEEIWLKRRNSHYQVVSKSILNILKLLLWGVGIVFILDNLGFNVAAIITGLGISGIAVALAAQTILGDLFNYFVIFFDRPFEEGDFIVSGNDSGTIEHIGIKSTRLRSLGGEQLMISNSNLMASRIRNYKRMQKRCVTFKVEASYYTSNEKLKRIPDRIQEIINKIDNTKLGRVHFKEFSDWGLVYEIVYYVLNADFNLYMDIQQRINLEIKESFEKEGIGFTSREPKPK